MPLIEPKNTIEVLQKHHFVFNKRFGQNFLIDPHVLEKIVAAAELTKEDAVLEIGPGIGTLTEALSDAAGMVLAIEIDDKLIPILKETLAGRENVVILHQDALKANLQELSTHYAGGKAFKVVANLPYYITTPIVMALLEGDAPVESLTVMVQKEVAARMMAKPGTKDYGALTLAVQYYSEPYLAANVPQNCFMPRPDVASAVIRLKKFETPPVKVQDPALRVRIIRASFNARRKTLVNGLKNAAELKLQDGAIRAALEKCGLSEMVRGETLSLEQFAALSDALLESM